MSQSNTSSGGELSPSAPRDAEYPPQHHAGAVGLGPEYGKGASLNDKFSGFKQEIKGKLKHDPNIVEHGRDLRTGEVKKREMGADFGIIGQSDETHPDKEKQELSAGQEQPDTMTERSEDKQ